MFPRTYSRLDVALFLRPCFSHGFMFFTLMQPLPQTMHKLLKLLCGKAHHQDMVHAHIRACQAMWRAMQIVTLRHVAASTAHNHDSKACVSNISAYTHMHSLTSGFSLTSLSFFRRLPLGLTGVSGPPLCLAEFASSLAVFAGSHSSLHAAGPEACHTSVWYVSKHRGN